MNTNIKTLIQMKIGDIKDLEKMQQDFNNKCGDIIDRQKETIASYIEQESVKEKWAKNFLKEMNINEC